MPRVKRQNTDAEPAAKRPKASSYRAILDTLDTLQTADGTRLLVTAFVKLPSKKLYPDYYALIDEPISLHEINKKVARDAYDTLQEFVADFQLMYDNAAKYNDPDSWIVQDAHTILQYLQDHQDDFQGSEEPGLAHLSQMCLSVINELITHDFPEEGPLSGPFLDDIDPDEYPDYYKLIEHPTSFRNVQARLEDMSLFDEESSPAENLQRFYDATVLIFTNAQAYNDDSSLIHEDLKKLHALFDEEFAALEASVLGQSSAKSAVKLKLKAPKEPLKLKLSYKGKDSSPSVEPVSGKKKRGRKPKRLLEQMAREGTPKQETPVDHDDDFDDDPEEDNPLMNATETCAMGKSKTPPSSDDVFIRRVTFASSSTVCSKVMNALSSQTSPPQWLKAELLKNSLYPEVAIANVASFFDYHFEPFGYSSKAYSITLSQDSSPITSFKVYLHELIYNIKRDDLIDGQGILKGKAEEDFMCLLYLNDEELTGGLEMAEEVDPADGKKRLLSLGYEIKLNYGLNIINFELRLSPSLSNSLKKKEIDVESTELAGRHTRQQTQQYKLNWDVEKFTLYVVSHGA